MATRVRLCLVTVLFCIWGAPASDAARIEPWNKSCLNDHKLWKKKAKHKAFAVTKVYSNGQGCAHSWNWPNVASAKKDALRRCQASLKKSQPRSKDRCIVILSQ